MYILNIINKTITQYKIIKCDKLYQVIFWRSLNADGRRFSDSFDLFIKDSLEDEIADIVIRLLDFAGLKGYKLLISEVSALPSGAIVNAFSKNGLSGTLFCLIGVLSDSIEDDSTEATVGIVINVFRDCFKTMTGSGKDLWWFVERKMEYNELRPMSNGKRYWSN